MTHKTCAYCNEPLPEAKDARYPGAPRTYCSNKCSQRAGYERRYGRRPKVERNESRYSKDANGQWWYVFGKTKPSRLRAFERVCQRCGKTFVGIDRSNRPGVYCSRQCSTAAVFARIPKADRSGAKARRWNGGRMIDQHGYVMALAPEHPSNQHTTRKYVQEHRLVMERVLGRFLTRGEQVHHKNGIRDDNSPDNLELWSLSHPSGQRVQEQQHCPTCTCFQLHGTPFMSEWTIESIRTAVAQSGRDPEYGDGFWEGSGLEIAVFLLGVIDGFHVNSGERWELVEGIPTRVQPTYPAEP